MSPLAGQATEAMVAFRPTEPSHESVTHEFYAIDPRHLSRPATRLAAPPRAAGLAGRGRVAGGAGLLPRLLVSLRGRCARRVDRDVLRGPERADGPAGGHLPGVELPLAARPARMALCQRPGAHRRLHVGGHRDGDRL